MASVSLAAERRGLYGRRACQKLRQKGLVPAVLYGSAGEVVSLVIQNEDVKTMLRGSEQLLDLQFEGATTTVLLKDVQYDPLGDHILHVDFQRIAMDQELKISVPVVARGHAPGVEKEGGVLEQLVRELEVICLPSKIPASIVVDVSSLALGQAVHIREMVLPEGVRTSAEPGLVVFHVARPQEEVVVAPAEEGPTEPELIRPPGRGEEEAAEGEVKEEKKKEEKK